MINFIKNKYPNLYIIIVALCVTMWFKGVNIILSKCIQNESLEVAAILISVALFVLYMDDKSLSELKNIRRPAAINMTANNDNY
jgi:hypothetical protein